MCPSHSKSYSYSATPNLLHHVTPRVLSGHKGLVYSVAFSPDGQLIASGGAMGQLILWQLDGTLLKTIQAHTSDIWGLAFSPGGKTIASASQDDHSGD